MLMEEARKWRETTCRKRQEIRVYATLRIISYKHLVLIRAPSDLLRVQ